MLDRRRLFGLVLAAAALAPALPAFAADPIVVGAYPSNPPWEFKNDAGTFEGFEVDVATEAAKRVGRPVEFQDLGFQALFAATASHRIDFAVSSISITNDRLQNQAFTQPYYDSDGTILGREGSQIAKFEDLDGKVIGVVSGTTGEKWANENAETYGIAEVKGYNAQQDLMLDIQNGRIDGGAGEIAGFQYAMTKIPGLKILIRIPTGERFAMMAPKDSAILPEINEAISAMKADGTLAKIHEKWFGVAPSEGTSTVVASDIPTAQ
ncbi:ABC transporter substrate-binding protein [Antarcticirhabdus aurantiaca]|uniref:ABC transporter substrate-binding protein n=1 Tax=Antarcticirhabdus aurantiaca TaxID=2606717 RepID=A0ACD4NMI1_9HYPH|nr:ABC transporter substrate-binding protein [Antarcticirhabdus aurantiaca]WAJ28135.1 ABC transporter substrate-binding protein [Jeongeuplla avenae]